MTLPREKSRAIEVDDEKYRYLVADRGREITLTIEADNAQGQLVTFQVPYVDPWLKFSVEQVSDEKLPDNQLSSITPTFVRKVILFALENGWQPHAKGKPIQLTLNEEGKELQQV